MLWLVFHRSLPSRPQHQRETLVWLLRITANPSAVSAATTASYTSSGVLPRSCGLACTPASGTGRVSCSIAFENGSRMLLTPSSWKLSRISPIGARSRPSGIWSLFSPAWWFAASAMSPLPFHVPLAPCQLPDFSLKRLPSASTTYRPWVLSGPRHAEGSGSSWDADEVATKTVPDTKPSNANVISDDLPNLRTALPPVGN